MERSTNEIRPIRFRGKRTSGKWAYGSLIKFDIGYIILTNEKTVSDDSLDERNSIVFSQDEIAVIIPETIGQFTGLLDKNGKEIYEGDILQRHCFNPKSINGEKVQFISQVYFSSTTNPSGWRIKNSTKTGGWSKGIGSNSIFNNDAVVIGNIHDNPELLKGGES